MDPTLQNLVNLSATFTSNLPDQNQLVDLCLTAALFGVPYDHASLVTWPEGLDRLSGEQLQNLKMYGTAMKLKAPLDGQALYSLSLTASAPQIVQPKLGFAHWNVLFRYLKLY